VRTTGSSGSAGTTSMTSRPGDTKGGMNMVRTAPIADLDRRFSSPGAKASSWADARRGLREANGLQLSTVRPDGRPQRRAADRGLARRAGRVVERDEREEASSRSSTVA
jgi:hypothetical protein